MFNTQGSKRSIRSEEAPQANPSTAILHEKRREIKHQFGQFENSPVTSRKPQSFFCWVYDSGLSLTAKAKSQCATLPIYYYLLSAVKILFKV